jgi:predicted nucleic acid-binding protein
MPYLADTNLLLRSAEAGHPMQETALQALASVRRGGETVYLTEQNLLEFWAVATRPTERNGLGLTVEAAGGELARLQALFPVLPEVSEIYPEWHRLVVTHGVVGLRIYDARLVAVMLVHGITHILTFNGADFRRYAHITVVEPAELLHPR